MPSNMPSKLAGSRYFFTLNVVARSGDVLVRHWELLRQSLHAVAEQHPFSILAMVILPEHLHCLLELPAEDNDYAVRWKLVQNEFASRLSKKEFLSRSRLHRRERGIWQRQYKEHKIANDIEFIYAMAYIRHDPVKHAYVTHPQDWPYLISGPQ